MNSTIHSNSAESKAQMKILRVTADMKIDVLDYPTGNLTEQNRALYQMIGKRCELFQVVQPDNMYNILRLSREITDDNPIVVAMLVDEEGYYHGLGMNPIGSILDSITFHGQPLLGTVLFIGICLGEDNEETFCGLPDKLLQHIKDGAEFIKEAWTS